MPSANDTRKRPPGKRPSRTPAVAARHAELIARAIAHIDTHLDSPLTAHVLADRAAMSRHHFHRVFDALVGCSVAGFVTERRLQRACALLVSGRERVLDIALEVGFDSAQSLAKAMRRDLDTSPSAVRRGDTTAWTHLIRKPRAGCTSSPTAPTGAPPMSPTRYADLPDGLVALTATARGMVAHSLHRAAQNAFGELMPPVARAGLLPAVASCICLVPDDPAGPDDPQCRYVAGFVFGYAMRDGSGAGSQPPVPLSGSLAWWPLSGGRYAVFTHTGPYTQLHQTWATIYRDWLPNSGAQLRDAPPMELTLNNPSTTPPEQLLTEIWLPLVSE